MDEVDEDVRIPESPADAERNRPLKRFRLGRYALMLLFAFMAAAYLASAVTSVIIAVASSGDSQVSLKRMTEGGTPVGGPFVSYGAFLLIAVLGVGLVVAAAVAAALFLGDRLRPTAWTVLAVVGIVSAAGALVALTLGTAELRMYLVSVAVCFVVLTAASLFELWRVRWVRRQWAAAPSAVAPSSAAGAPAA